MFTRFNFGFYLTVAITARLLSSCGTESSGGAIYAVTPPTVKLQEKSEKCDERSTPSVKLNFLWEWLGDINCGPQPDPRLLGTWIKDDDASQDCDFKIGDGFSAPSSVQLDNDKTCKTSNAAGETFPCLWTNNWESDFIMVAAVGYTGEGQNETGGPYTLDNNRLSFYSGCFFHKQAQP